MKATAASMARWRERLGSCGSAARTSPSVRFGHSVRPSETHHLEKPVILFRSLTFRAACALLVAASLAPSAVRGQEGGQDAIPLGSTRNAVAAIPLSEMPDELVYLTSRLSDELVDSLRILAPNVTIINDLDRDSALEHASRAHGADAHPTRRRPVPVGGPAQRSRPRSRSRQQHDYQQVLRQGRQPPL